MTVRAAITGVTFAITAAFVGLLKVRARRPGGALDGAAAARFHAKKGQPGRGDQKHRVDDGDQRPEQRHNPEGPCRQHLDERVDAQV